MAMPAYPDVFLALAEPLRREILELLGRRGRMGVTAIVETLRRPQPTVSKHLGVLRRTGLVSVAKLGRQRVYAVEAAPLRAVHDWTLMFERFWDHKLDRIQARAERAARADSGEPAAPTRRDIKRRERDGRS
ncbi:MAG: ArsR family transcriptional regulator [Phycisphaerales bacterium]|nr:MAG: ArsR family transcriptional regulator [Phycisphaerales bacterium]